MKKFLGSLFAALTLVFTLTAQAAPASAHDEVTGSYPEANSSVEAGTFAVSVTFNEDVMQVADNAGIAIAITGPDGTAAPTACLSVDGPQISALASLDKAGDYTVDWRSVSNDGHANSGSFKFSLTNTTEFVAEDPVNACDMARTAVGGATPMPLIAPGPVMYDDAAKSDDSNSTLTWVGLGIGAGLIILGSVFGALRLRAKERKQESEPEILTDDEPKQNS